MTPALAARAYGSVPAEFTKENGRRLCGSLTVERCRGHFQSKVDELEDKKVNSSNRVMVFQWGLSCLPVYTRIFQQDGFYSAVQKEAFLYRDGRHG